VKNALRTAASVAAVSFAVPALAESQLELTLDAWIAMAKAQGGMFEYSAKNVGGDGSVEYRDLRLGSSAGDFGIDAQWMRLTPDGDRTVVTLSPVVTVTFTPPEATEPASLTLESENFALATNAIVPDPTVLTQVSADLTADLLKLGNLTGNPPGLSDLAFEQTGLAMGFAWDGTAETAGGSWTADVVDVLYDFAAEGMESSSDSVMNDWAMSFSFDIAGEDDFPKFLTGEKDFSARFASSGGTGIGATRQEGMAFAYETESGASEGVLELVGGLLTYSVKGVDTTFLISPEGMPMPPVNASVKEVGMDVIVPFSAKDAPGEAKVALKFADLAVGEELWAMVDPGQTIPRDPLNIDINLTSMVQVTGDIAAAMEAETPPMPTEVVQVSDLTVRSFLISAAGASIKAGGGLTFDNSGPMPLPSGKVSLEVNGVQGLSQKLVDLGLIPQDQSMMMLGMMMSFAQPGAAPDQFTSDIEFLPDGSVTANGQPLPM
jgi:hypothetical protein